MRTARHRYFPDKDVIFTTEMLDRNSPYPVYGTVACEIIAREILDGIEIVKIDTAKHWGIEATTGETIFEVFAGQILGFEVPVVDKIE